MSQVYISSIFSSRLRSNRHIHVASSVVEMHTEHRQGRGLLAEPQNAYTPALCAIKFNADPALNHSI